MKGKKKEKRKRKYKKGENYINNQKRKKDKMKKAKKSLWPDIHLIKKSKRKNKSAKKLYNIAQGIASSKYYICIKKNILEFIILRSAYSFALHLITRLFLFINLHAFFSI